VETPRGDGRLAPAECFPIEYRNDENIFSLPNCCDLPEIDAIAQCASFAVTAVDGQACSPAFISSASFSAESRDGRPVQFGCGFFPTNHETAPSWQCLGDCDLDGTIDSCETPPADRDADSDGFGAACDCDDGVPEAWAVPGEVVDLRLFHDATSGNPTLSWSPPDDPGGGSVAYDTLRSADPANFVSALTCVEADDGLDTTSTDTGVVSPLAFYLVRAENACPAGQGSVGTDSDGVPRVAGACP
jgi:hypothetical protein